MLLTITEAAAKYGYNAQHLRRLVEKGTIPARRVNARLWLVEDEEVARYAATRQRPGRPKRQEER